MEPKRVERKQTLNNLMHKLEQIQEQQEQKKPGWLNEIKKHLNEKSNDINWDLIELDAAVAMATSDNKEYRKIQKHLRQQLTDYYGPKPDGLITIATEDMRSLQHQVGGTVRRLMSRALQTAIFYKDYNSTEKILIYAHSNTLIMHVFPVNIEFLVDQRQYNIISLLIFYTCLLRTPLTQKPS